MRNNRTRICALGAVLVIPQLGCQGSDADLDRKAIVTQDEWYCDGDTCQPMETPWVCENVADGQWCIREDVSLPSESIEWDCLADVTQAETICELNMDTDSAEKTGTTEQNGTHDSNRTRGLPPGLAKRETLPPGLAKRETLPPGLAKRAGDSEMLPWECRENGNRKHCASAHACVPASGRWRCSSSERGTTCFGRSEASQDSPPLSCRDLKVDCPLDDLDEDAEETLWTGGCWVTGGGHFGDETNRGGAGKNKQDSFGFNAMGMKDGRVRGELQNTTHLGDLFHGKATWIRCWKDDGPGPDVPRAIPNNAEFGGHGLWNHEEGYTWKVHIIDRREGGSRHDVYELWVYDGSGDLVYSQTADDRKVITGGNLQIHPPNGGHPYTSDMANP